MFLLAISEHQARVKKVTGWEVVTASEFTPMDDEYVEDMYGKIYVTLRSKYTESIEEGE